MASGIQILQQFFIDYLTNSSFKSIRYSHCINFLYFSYKKIEKLEPQVPFLFFFAHFFPVLMKLSRGSYIGIIIFIFFELYYQKNFLLNEKENDDLHTSFSFVAPFSYRMTGVQISSGSIQLERCFKR